MESADGRTLGRRFAGLVPAIAMCGFMAEARATILLFDEARDAATHTIVVPTTSGATVEQDYGDRVTGSPQSVLGGQFTYGNAGENFTPNVLVEYFLTTAAGAGGAISLWGNDYGDLSNVLFGSQGSNALNIRLTADAAFEVLLYHFDLAGWSNSDYEISAVRVLSGGNTLFEQASVQVEGDFSGPRHTAFDFLSPLTGSELLIEIDYSNLASNQQDNIGIDNVRFGQVPPSITALPEPTTWLLLTLGLGMVLARSRLPTLVGRRRPHRAKGSAGQGRKPRCARGRRNRMS
jgi:hypothetical protein